MSQQFPSRAGLVAVVAGVLGAVSAIVLLVWPAQVGEGVVSYPFTTTGFAIAQTWFFVHHFGLVLALVALTVPAIGGGRPLVRWGGWAAVAGMVALSLTELLAIQYASWDDDAANAGLMGTAYGISVTVVGLGMLAAGVGILRAAVWHGWRRWTPLAIGIATFTVLTPGMFGGFVIARLAIGLWMLLFTALGWSLHIEARHPRTESQPRGVRPAAVRTG